MLQEMQRTRQAIRAGCAFFGVSQKELAERLGMSPETMSRKMSGSDFTERELISAEKEINWRRFT